MPSARYRRHRVSGLVSLCAGCLCLLASSVEASELDFGQLPISFEANRGQTDARVEFLRRGADHALFFTKTGVVIRLVYRVVGHSEVLSMTDGAFQTERRNLRDLFVSKLNAAGSELIYSTLIGGFGNDRAFSCALGPNNELAFVGGTGPDLSAAIQSDAESCHVARDRGFLGHLGGDHAFDSRQ